MRISQILWNAESVAHISRHRITPQEVEEAVFDGNPLVFKTRDKRYVVLSQTLSGRYLMVVIAFKLKGRVSVITARDMDEKERKYYRRRGK